MSKLLHILAFASILLLSCDKNSNTNEADISLKSPDGKMNLSSSLKELIAAINKSTGINEAREILSIEYPKCSKGYYAIVTYAKTEGESTIVYSPFPLATKSSSTVIHTNNSKTVSTNMVVPACYEYWCTTAGNCTSCGVRVSDPFGTPSLSCSCNECHLHQKKYDCPQ